jgi:hypothetical protein
MASSGKAWIVVTWQGDVVHSASLTRGQCFSLGTGTRDWPFPEALLGVESRTLVDYCDETPKVWGQPGQWQDLTSGKRSITEIGPFCVIATAVGSEDDEVELGRLAPSFEPPLFWIGSVAAALAMLVASAYAIPALADVELVTTSESPTWLIQHYLQGDTGDTGGPQGPDVLLGIASEESRFAEQVLGSRTNCVGYEKMGRRQGKKTDQRYAITGPRDNPDPHVSRQSASRKPKFPPDPESRLGVIGVGLAGDPDAPSAPWGRDSSLGTDEVSARGNLWGDTIGDTAGDDGLLRSSLDGGLVKRIEVVRPERSLAGRPARVLHAQLSVHGSLSPHDVEFAVAAQGLAAFRDCYRADSESRSDHEAHLDLGFEIKSTGELTQIRVLKRERVEPPLLNCVLDSAKKLAFPPENGDSIVTYPLHFMPSTGEASRPVEIIALAREIHRETELPKPCSGPEPHPTKKLQPCSR